MTLENIKTLKDLQGPNTIRAKEEVPVTGDFSQGIWKTRMIGSFRWIFHDL